MAVSRSAGARRSTLRVTVVGQSAGRSAAGLGPWLERAAPRRAAGEVNLALVSDREMRVLNRTFRRKDAPTDVLSFPSGIRDGRGPRTRDGRGPGTRNRRATRTDPGSWTRAPAPLLGDLAIALGVARRQAREFGHSLSTELKILALHGVLHLLGYDHERDAGAMRRAEDRLRRRAGLPTGLTARAAAVRRRSR